MCLSCAKMAVSCDEYACFSRISVLKFVDTQYLSFGYDKVSMHDSRKLMFEFRKPFCSKAQHARQELQLEWEEKKVNCSNGVCPHFASKTLHHL